MSETRAIMVTKTDRATQRWERLLEIIEAMGFERTHTWEEALRVARQGRRAYWTRHCWYGVGSSYVTLRDRDATIKVRLSDHAPVEGGGMRYDPLVGSHYRAGESDVSIHPGGEVTLRNVRRQIEAALDRAREELAAELEEEAPRVEVAAAPIQPVPAPIDPEEAERRERLAAEKRERERREKGRRARFREEWQALRATLTPEHFRRWRELGTGRPGARALAAELGCKPSVLYAALTGGGKL